MSIDFFRPMMSTKIQEAVRAVLMMGSVLVTTISIGWVLNFSRHGIDLTDESFYLVSIVNPFLYSVSATQFGFIYHPLFKLVEGDVATLRQINLVITLGLSFLLSYVVFLKGFKECVLSNLEKVCLSAGISTIALTALVFAGLWLPTPSYNSLTLQSILIAGVGLMLATKSISFSSACGWIFLGIAGGITFLAKPTSAIALMACVSVYLIFAKNFNSLGVLLAIALAAIFVAVFGLLIDGSLTAFIERLRGGAQVGQILGGGHDTRGLFRLDIFNLGVKGLSVLIFVTLLFFGTAYLVQANVVYVRFIGVAFSLCFGLASGLIISNLWPDVLGRGQFYALLLWSIPFAAIILLVVSCRLRRALLALQLNWSLVILFCVLPFAYAFGTNTNYWILASQASIFWVLAAGVILGGISSNRFLVNSIFSLVLATQLIVVMVVQAGLERPYRQPQPLRDQNYLIEFGKNSPLLVSEDFKRYLDEVRDIATDANFKPGTPVIDLSGVSPGVLYFLGAKSIGQAWTIGGYRGSNQLAAVMQEKVSCQDLAVAWLLMEPEGVAKISQEILGNFGANWPEDYVLAGEFTALGSATENNHLRRQQLFVPQRSVELAISSCYAARNQPT